MTGTHLDIFFDESLLVALPDSAGLRKELTFTFRSIEEDKDEQDDAGDGPPPPTRRKAPKLVETVRPWFIEVKRDGVAGLQTYAGFWQRLRDWGQERGMTVRVHDMRGAFPVPRFDLMYGFRFSQEALLKEGLEKNLSGLFEAPTRWGKTTLIVNTIRAYPGLVTVVVMPGVDLLRQQADDLRRMLPGREVVVMGGSSTTRLMGRDITVCSMDSMHKLEHKDVQLVLVDEPHQLVTDNRLEDFQRLDRARKLGFGATMTGRFDRRDDLIIGAIGPVLARRTYREAVLEGSICPIVVLGLCLDLEARARHCYKRNRLRVYQNMMLHNQHVHEIAAWINNTLIPPDWQTITFVAEQKQGEALAGMIPGSVLAMDKVMTGSVRKNVMRDMKKAEILRCLASNIYSTGITFSHLMAVVNLAGGSRNTLSIQKPGRLAEIRPGKRFGLMVDILWRLPPGSQVWREPAGCLARDTSQRLAAYAEKGYMIHMAHGYKQAARILEGLNDGTLPVLPEAASEPSTKQPAGHGATKKRLR